MRSAKSILPEYGIFEQRVRILKTVRPARTLYRLDFPPLAGEGGFLKGNVSAFIAKFDIL